MNRLFAPLALALGSVSCIAAHGLVPISNQSIAQLDQDNFTVVSTGLRGEASVVVLFNLIPLGDAAVASRAMDQLVASAETSGKARALANYSGDVIRMDFLIFEIITVQLRADAVEFNK